MSSPKPRRSHRLTRPRRFTTLHTIDFLRSNIQRTPFVTLTLALVLWALYLSSDDLSSGASQVLLERWGSAYLKVTQGEPWRLLTYAALHTSATHLTFNLIGLLILGVRVERVVGHLAFMSLSIGCATLAGVFSLWWRDFQLSVGASGLVYGLLGAEVTLMVGLKHASALLRQRRLNVSFLLGALWLVGGLILGVTLDHQDINAQQVDHATHLTGVVVGAFLGLSLLGVKGYGVNPLSARGLSVGLSPLVLSLVVVGGLWVFKPTPPGLGGYLASFLPQELELRRLEGQMSALSVAEQRLMWRERFEPVLSQAHHELKALLEPHAARPLRGEPLLYASLLESYVQHWRLSGQRYLLPSGSPQEGELARLQQDLRRSTAMGAERLRRYDLERLEHLHASSALELQQRLSLFQGSSALSDLLADEEARHAAGALEGGLELLTLNELRAEASALMSRETNTRLYQTLKACLSKVIDHKIKRTAPQERQGVCASARDEVLMYVSLSLYELASALGRPAHERFTWLDLSLWLLRRALSDAELFTEELSLPLVALSPDESLRLSDSLVGVYAAWAQRAASELLRLSPELEGVSAEAKWARVDTLERSTGLMLWRPFNTRCAWRLDPRLEAPPLLSLSGLPPSEESLALVRYQASSGQEWLISLTSPARVSERQLLSPLHPQSPYDVWSVSGELSEGLLTSEGACLSVTLVPRSPLSAQRLRWEVSSGEERLEGWSIWPLGLSQERPALSEGEGPVKPAVEPNLEPAVKPSAEPAVKPLAEPAVKPSAEPDVEP